METANLCKCNYCDSILIDENPQVGAPLYDLKDYPQALEMQRVSAVINDPETEYWACPNCLTDSFLTDNI